MEDRQRENESARQLVVLAYYDRRPLDPVLRLAESMDSHNAGTAYDLVVVVNRSEGQPLDDLKTTGLPYIEKPNFGMNIGSWDHAWRQLPNYDGYLFLQDECVIGRDGWLQAFVDAAGPDVGLVGESLNENWDRCWTELRRTRGHIPVAEHTLAGRPANRVEVYLDFMARHGIDPGPTGRHLRGQVWYARREPLEDIDGFRYGENYGECIAAEIAVSRLMEANGWSLAQVDAEPFHYIHHTEWVQSSSDAPYQHLDSIGRLARTRWRLTG